MIDGTFSDYRVAKWLADLDTVWVGLHYADPVTAGAYASEVFGGSYGRRKANFSEPDNRVVFNENTLVFKGLPTVKITHIGGWDSHYNGNLEFSIPLLTPTTVMAGRSYEILANQLAISLP